jgi:hypothetical protein
MGTTEGLAVEGMMASPYARITEFRFKGISQARQPAGPPLGQEEEILREGSWDE